MFYVALKTSLDVLKQGVVAKGGIEPPTQGFSGMQRTARGQRLAVCAFYQRLKIAQPETVPRLGVASDCRTFPCPAGSAVHLAPMPDADHVHDHFLVGQVADDAVIANSIAPGVGVSTQRLASAARIALDKFFEESEEPALYRPVEFRELLFSSRGESSRPGQDVASPGPACEYGRDVCARRGQPDNRRLPAGTAPRRRAPG